MHITCHAGKNRETGIFCRIGGDKGHEARLWGLERYIVFGRSLEECKVDVM